MNLKLVNKKKVSIYNRYICVCCIFVKMFKFEIIIGIIYERFLYIEYFGLF